MTALFTTRNSTDELEDRLRRVAADVPVAKERLQARMHHRVILMVSMATRYDTDHLAAVEGGLAALAIGKCIVKLQASQEMPSPDAGGISDALRRLSDAVRRKEPIATALADVSVVFCAALGQGGGTDHNGQRGEADCQRYWEDGGAQCPV